MMCPDPSVPHERTGDEITELEFELADPAYFFVGLSEERTCRVRLEDLIRQEDGPYIEFFTATDCTASAVRDRAERTDPVDSVRILADAGEETVFRMTISGSCVSVAIERAGAVTHSLVAVDGVGRFVVQVPRCVDPRDVIDAVLDRHPASELVARRHHEVSTPTFTSREFRELARDRLTERQWEVLRTAYAEDYFDRPRAHTGGEVAETLGISNATFSQHIRSAQRKLLSLLLDGRDASDR